jgi:hypothetical protein
MAVKIVEGLCLGKPKCSVPVDFQLFRDGCTGKKALAVKVQCSTQSEQSAG